MNARLGAKAKALQWLKPVHRYLGLGLSILLLLWFLSGIVMMFHAYPRTAEAERMADLSELSSGEIAVHAEQAADLLGEDRPGQVRMNQPGQRPMIHLLSPGEGWRSVYADAPEAVPALDADKAEARARELGAATIRRVDVMDSADQWTLSALYDPWRPLWRVTLDDDDGSIWYFSEATHEKVHATTRSERTWAYAGAVVHWIYPTQLRELSGIWRQVVMWLAGLAGIACLSGLVIGVLSLRRNRGRGFSHYRGALLWHHYLGLGFGVLALTWLFSGLLSLNPFSWSSQDLVEPTAITSALGGSDADALGDWPEPNPILESDTPLEEIREMETWRVNERTGYRAVGADGRDLFIDPEAPEGERTLEAEDTREAAAAVSGLELQDFVEQDEYDHYYYPGRAARVRDLPMELPVYRAEYEDDIQLYIDPDTAGVLIQSTPRARANRWLYNGLHSLEFPFLNPGSSGWYVLMILLSGVGVLFSATGVWLTIRYLAGRGRH